MKLQQQTVALAAVSPLLGVRGLGKPLATIQLHQFVSLRNSQSQRLLSFRPHRRRRMLYLVVQRIATRLPCPAFVKISTALLASLHQVRCACNTLSSSLFFFFFFFDVGLGVASLLFPHFMIFFGCFFVRLSNWKDGINNRDQTCAPSSKTGASCHFQVARLSVSH